MFAVFLVLDYGVQRYIVFPSFQSLERSEATKDIERCRTAVAREIEHLNSFTADWASWDDTYQFVEDRNDTFIKTNLLIDTFVDAKMNLICVFDNTGKVVWGESYDLSADTPVPVTVVPKEGFPVSSPLIRNESITDGKFDFKKGLSGIWPTPYGLMFVSSHHILTSSNVGPSRGTLVMGRFVTPDIITKLGEQTRLPFRIYSSGSDAAQHQHRTEFDQLSAGQSVVLNETNDDQLDAFLTIDGIHGKPVAMIHGQVNRHITVGGRNAMMLATVSLAGVALILIVVLAIALRRMVVKPVQQLQTFASNVAGSGDLTQQVELGLTDEIGQLADELNHMVDRLNEARTRYIDAARQAGIADVATGVLHNVGNVLNSVYLSGSLIEDRLKRSRVESLVTISNLLEDHDDDLMRFIREDERAHTLPATIKHLTTRLMNERQSLIDEVHSLRSKIEQMHSVIRMQQAHARILGVIESVEVTDLVEEALKMNEISQGVHGITVRKEYRDRPIIQTDRHRVVTILINLIGNAKDSLVESGKEEYIMTLRVVSEHDETVRIEVEDNGSGIDKDSLNRIFNYGYTTKANGSGFGLHSSVLAAEALGGCLKARSDGPGKGATFILELPIEQAASVSVL